MPLPGGAPPGGGPPGGGPPIMGARGACGVGGMAGRVGSALEDLTGGIHDKIYLRDAEAKIDTSAASEAFTQSGWAATKAAVADLCAEARRGAATTSPASGAVRPRKGAARPCKRPSCVAPPVAP